MCKTSLKGGLHQTIFFVSNDTMKGPESREKIFLIMKISVTVKIHPLCTSGSERKFQMGPCGAVYVMSQGDSTLNILRESYCFCPLLTIKNKENGFSEVF